MTTQASVLDALNKSERAVHDYIQQNTSKENNFKFTEPMKSIGQKLGKSEATIHRAITKLSKSGIIEILPASERTKSDEIIYIGPSNVVEDFSEAAQNLTIAMNRFNRLINQEKNKSDNLTGKLDKLQKENEELRKQLNESENTIQDLKDLLAEDNEVISKFSEDKLVGVTDIDETTRALIFTK